MNIKYLLLVMASVPFFAHAAAHKQQISFDESMVRIVAAVEAAKQDGKQVHLILGALPFEARMAATERPDVVRIYWDETPLAAEEMAKVMPEDSIINTNFNDAAYWDALSSIDVLVGAFDAIYFDWSTVKFAYFSLWLVIDLLRLLKQGGSFYIPTAQLLSSIDFAAGQRLSWDEYLDLSDRLKNITRALEYLPYDPEYKNMELILSGASSPSGECVNNKGDQFACKFANMVNDIKLKSKLHSNLPEMDITAHDGIAGYPEIGFEVEPERFTNFSYVKIKKMSHR